MTIAQGVLPFQLVADQSQVVITSFGGLPLVMETFRAPGSSAIDLKTSSTSEASRQVRASGLCRVLYLGLCRWRGLF
ncbi:MAG: hypothetical protein FJ117_15355 [Deltaproteobacteria bacterium]|nr:hypothetical protein [Deltaproteobacteria bacterium]